MAISISAYALGPIYKLSCLAAALAGLIVAFPIMTYAFIMGIANLANDGWLILLGLALSVGAVGWGALRSITHLRSMVWSSFIMPTVAGAIGITLVVIGLPFAQHPPGA